MRQETHRFICQEQGLYRVVRSPKPRTFNFFMVSIVISSRQSSLICLLIARMHDTYFCPMLFINGNKCSFYKKNISRWESYLSFWSPWDTVTNSPYEVPFKNEWYHVEVTFPHCLNHTSICTPGIHIFKQESCMEDIQFVDPNRK